MNLNRCSSLNELQEKYEFEKSMILILSRARKKELIPHPKKLAKNEVAFSKIQRSAFMLNRSGKKRLLSLP